MHYCLLKKIPLCFSKEIKSSTAARNIFFYFQNFLILQIRIETRIIFHVYLFFHFRGVLIAATEENDIHFLLLILWVAFASGLNIAFLFFNFLILLIFLIF